MNYMDALWWFLWLGPPRKLATHTTTIDAKNTKCKLLLQGLLLHTNIECYTPWIVWIPCLATAQMNKPKHNAYRQFRVIILPYILVPLAQTWFVVGGLQQTWLTNCVTVKYHECVVDFVEIASDGRKPHDLNYCGCLGRRQAQGRSGCREGVILEIINR